MALTTLFDQIKGSLNWIPNPNPQQSIVNRTIVQQSSKFFKGTPNSHIKSQLSNMDSSYRK